MTLWDDRFEHLHAMTGNEYLRHMMDNTDNEGILVLPDFPYGIEGIISGALRCRMCWGDKEALPADYESLRGALQAYGEAFSRTGNADAAQAMLTPEQNLVVKNYLADIDCEGFDREQIQELGNRIFIFTHVQALREKTRQNILLSEEEADYLADNQEVSIADQEQEHFLLAAGAIVSQYTQRIGNSPFAPELIQRARRYCRLVEMAAPAPVCHMEARHLAAAYALHKCCASFQECDISLCRI